MIYIIDLPFIKKSFVIDDKYLDYELSPITTLCKKISETNYTYKRDKNYNYVNEIKIVKNFSCLHNDINNEKVYLYLIKFYNISTKNFEKIEIIYADNINKIKKFTYLYDKCENKSISKTYKKKININNLGHEWEYIDELYDWNASNIEKIDNKLYDPSKNNIRFYNDNIMLKGLFYIIAFSKYKMQLNERQINIVNEILMP